MNTVKKPLTPHLPRQRRRDVVENDAFAAFARRIHPRPRPPRR